MKKTAYLEVDFDEKILKYIDLDLVVKAIDAPADTNLALERECRETILLAAQTWLPRDLQEFEEIKIEENFKDGLAFMDLQGKMRGTMAPFDRYPGKWVIFDWKTSSGPLDDKWREGCILSWQWKEYAALAPDTKFFIYRGVARDCAVWKNDIPRTREVPLELEGPYDYEVGIQTEGVLLMRNSICHLPIWPRNSGLSSCRAYGTDCPFKDDCDNNTMPPRPLDTRLTMSYSRKKEFLLCPERCRRTEIAKLEDSLSDSSENLEFGSMFHRGIAEIYRQAFQMKLNMTT